MALRFGSDLFLDFCLMNSSQYFYETGGLSVVSAYKLHNISYLGRYTIDDTKQKDVFNFVLLCCVFPLDERYKTKGKTVGINCVFY